MNDPQTPTPRADPSVRAAAVTKLRQRLAAAPATGVIAVSINMLNNILAEHDDAKQHYNDAVNEARAEHTLLDSATKFTFGPFGDPQAISHSWIDVEARPGPKGIRWSIMCSGWAYTRDGTWTWERIAGERTQQYLDTTRWESCDDAVAIARRLIADGHPHTTAWTKGRRLP